MYCINVLYRYFVYYKTVIRKTVSFVADVSISINSASRKDLTLIKVSVIMY